MKDSNKVSDHAGCILTHHICSINHKGKDFFELINRGLVHEPFIAKMLIEKA